MPGQVIRSEEHFTLGSVLGAETYGCVHGISAAIYVRRLTSEIIYDDLSMTVIPIKGYVDTNQLFQQITSTKQSVDTRIRLNVAGIRETVRID